jgi:tetratricopeptide (TPR) repeat protein
MDLFKSITHYRWLGLPLLIAMVLIAYSFVLQAPFRGLDDSVMIVDNHDIRSFQNIPKIFTSSFFGDRSYYRPLVSLSYMLEYRLAGLRAYVYYWDNIVLHILNALAVYFLIFRFFRDRPIAFGVSFLFAIHPIQWEAVANISGRVILLNTFFLLMAFSWFIDFREKRKLVCLIGSVASFFLALLCKESAAMFPVVLLAYLAFLPQPGPAKSKPWLSVTPFFLIVFAMILLRHRLGITELFGWGSFDAMVRGFLSFARGVITYLRLFILPVDLYFDRSRAVFANFANVELWMTAAFWPAAFWALWRWRSKISPAILFCMAWFALELAPVSQIATSLGVQPGFISLAEHFLYLPSIAVFTVGVLVWRKVCELNASRQWFSPTVGSAAVGAFMTFFFLTTIQQNLYAGNDVAMLERSIEQQPVNSRVQYSLGMYYVNLRMFDRAGECFARAVAMDPWNVRAKIALGKALCDQGRYEEGITVYESIRDAGRLQHLLDENLRLSYQRWEELHPQYYE